MPYTFDATNTAKVERAIALLTEARALLGEVFDLPMSEILTEMFDMTLEHTDAAIVRAKAIHETVR